MLMKFLKHRSFSLVEIFACIFQFDHLKKNQLTINMSLYIVGGMGVTELRNLYVMTNHFLNVSNTFEVGNKGAAIDILHYFDSSAWQSS